VEAGTVPKRDLAVLYLAMLVSRVGFGVIIIVFPFYISRSSDISVAVALALYPILEAATALPMGRLCDMRGRKNTFVISLGFMAALMASIGLTRNIYGVASIHALMGVSAAGVTVSTLTMITDLTAERNRGAGMGTFDFMNVGGYAVGLLLGSRLDAAFSTDLSIAFYVTGVVVAAAFVVALAALREPPHVARGRDLSLNPLKALDAKAKAILPIWLGVTVILGVAFFLPRAFERAGIGGSMTAEILVAGVLVLGMGAVGFGALSDVIGRMKVLLIGVIGLFGLLASLGVSLHVGLEGLMRSLPVIGVFALATSALVPTILATAGDRAAQGRRGSAMGLYSVMLGGGTAVGTLAAGVAHRASGLMGIIEVAAFVFAAACLASLLLWVRVPKLEPGKAAQSAQNDSNA
jgi:MFS family permease